MRVLVLMVLALGLIASGEQENTLSLTGLAHGPSSSGEWLLQEIDASSSYTSAGKIYGDEAGSFTLNLVADSAYRLQFEASVSAMLFSPERERYWISNKSNTVKVIKPGGECIRLITKPSGGKAYRLRFQEEFYLDISNLRLCRIDFRITDGSSGDGGGKEIQLKKIFDADSGKLLLIDVSVYYENDTGTDYTHRVNWEVLTPTGKAAISDCATDSGINACYDGNY